MSSSAPLPLVSQQLIDFAKTLFKRHIYVNVAMATLAISTSGYIISTESEAGVVACMSHVFEAGGCPGWDSRFSNDKDAKVERPVVDEGIRGILRPAIVKKYAAIVGSTGVGKSTAVRRAVHELTAEFKGVAGVVYFSSPELIMDFSPDLARVVGYRTPIRWWDTVRRLFTRETSEQAKAPASEREPRATWSALVPFLRKAASEYKAKHGRAPTLVLDAMDRVEKDDPSFFTKVQDFAKQCADDGVLRIVMVFSDGNSLPLLLSSSTASRCEVFEVGEISKADAVQYVLSQYPNSRYGKDAGLAYELVKTVTGGRFPLLDSFGSSDQSLQQIRAPLDIQVGQDLLLSGVDSSHPLFVALTSSGSLPYDLALQLLKKDTLKELLSHNILAAHPGKTYSFHTHHVETFFQKKGEERTKKELEERTKKELEERTKKELEERTKIHRCLAAVGAGSSMLICWFAFHR